MIIINHEKCTNCGICLEQFGCPSFIRNKEGQIIINRFICNSNGSCIQVCPEKAIERSTNEETT
ncbi:MAG: ferredoxin [Spirochaetales bacterium]|nr:ferredoxin [Spirochaetales bacterium]